ncbi:hypothetical protein LEAN103870_07715 [Legionella anisa]|uniref:Uncharacterized protein n=1 Tax=Legionella anisa TaxID=28082 RepID=A0AAX0WTF1_9GAMM|nr:hypothetical protein [Legionella anisa]AWN74506.1 hypothetical protein DLD14_11985 [Legionella anisa]KTC76570.1 hypothetical protein Lani_0300 [Legionella anisa]MCW8425381.1 hypothetical protein [Legionella anisa]MCW8449188.1 hypothetical protein [Legionella anisa]PNL61599.1 hypothetical protein A6J39_010465 [Legionella anisa]
MYGLYEFGASFFGRRAALSAVRITGAAYDSHNIVALELFKKKHNINLVEVTVPSIYRGVSVEHYLGCLDRPGLGISAMRPNFARYLKSKGYTCSEDLSPSEKKELIEKHVKGFSLVKGNTKLAHSFTHCPSVAFGFGLDAAKKSNFPNISLIGVAAKALGIQAWDVEYDPLTIEGEEFGTSIFSYQCETIVPHLHLPINQCIVINQKTSGMIQLDDLRQAKRFDVSESSILELSIIPIEKMKKYQQLEIDKVIAYDDFATYVIESKDPKDIKNAKAAELYANYKGILKAQAALVNLPLCERDLWINVASTVAPNTYTCISAHTDGFTIELPAKSGGALTITISNIEAIICLAPLFEKDPTLTLDQIKNGELPCALNYLTESVIRKNQDLICQTGLEQCVEHEENQKLALV